MQVCRNAFSYQIPRKDVITIRSLYKRRSNIAKDQRIIILRRLVCNNSRIRAVRWHELVFSTVGSPC